MFTYGQMNYDYFPRIEHNFNKDFSSTDSNDIFNEYLFHSAESISNMNKKNDVPISNNIENGKKTEKKNLLCTVCGARAFGYNFDRITCESCKAFFRRNALRNMMDLQCRFGGNCDINVENRRHCTYCRIKKCFDIGMRKEWIRSEEEKHKKQNQNEKYRKNKQTKRRLQISILRQSEKFDSSLILSSSDRVRLNNVNHCYDQYTGEPSISAYFAPHQILTLRLHDFFNRKKQVVINFISYFKHLPEFQKLHIDDQVLLIKQNVRVLLPLNYALLKTPIYSQFRYTHIQTVGCVDNINLHVMYQFLSNTFVPFVTFDPIGFKLFLIILFLTTDLLLTTMETFTYKQLGYIQKIQCSYTKLLWLYMIEKYGEKRAIFLYTKLITTFLHLQTAINQIDSIIRLNHDIEHIDVLMKSILQLT